MALRDDDPIHALTRLIFTLIDTRDFVGTSLLHALGQTVYSRNLDMTLQAINLLLRQTTANVNVRDRNGSTVLHCLVGRLRKDTQDVILTVVTNLLVEHRADVTIQNDEGWTAMHCLCNNLDDDNQEATLALISLFLDYGANATAKTKDGFTPLQLLANSLSKKNQDVSLLMMKLLFGYDDNDVTAAPKNRDGVTTLRCLAQMLYKENQEGPQTANRQKFVLEDGSDDNKVQNTMLAGMTTTTLHRLNNKDQKKGKQEGLEALTRLLMEYGADGADASTQTPDGTTDRNNQESFLVMMKHLFGYHMANVTTQDKKDGVTTWYDLTQKLGLGKDEPQKGIVAMINRFIMEDGAEDITAKDKEVSWRILSFGSTRIILMRHSQ